MDHATALRPLRATPFVTSLFPLTVRLIPVITQIGRLIAQFRRADVTPQVTHRFETQLHDQLRELGRIIVEWTFNADLRGPKPTYNVTVVRSRSQG